MDLEISQKVSVSGFDLGTEDSLTDEQLVEFVLDIDEGRGDLNFTKTLHARLGEIIKVEGGDPWN